MQVMLNGGDYKLSKQGVYVADNLKRLIKEKGYRVEFVAHKSGLSKSLIYTIMQGEVNASVKSLAKLATFFDIPLAELFKEPSKTE